MTTIPALSAVPGTVLATAALTSQEALAAVTDAAVLGDPVEATNFAIVVGVMALHMREKISSRVTGNIGSPVSQDILGLASEVLERSSSRNSVPVLKTDFSFDLRRYLLRMNHDAYQHYAQAALQSGLAVFGHAAQSAAQSAPANAWFDPVSGEVTFPNATPSAPAILTPFDPDAPDFIGILIEEVVAGDKEAADQLRIRADQTPWAFTAKDVADLANIKGEIFIDLQIGRILDALLESRPELFSGG
ncbi:MAG: hypothetical protein Q8P84_03920 [Deltaproteobacteria bacterium]|nr:hypothetical protein [Deltaproteobacteria bacterium]